MKALALIAATLLASSVFAAEPAAPAKHSCTAPEHPGNLASESQQKSFNKANKTYGECIKQFVDAQNQIAKAAADAGNAAIKEYNEYAKQMNALAGN
ncbi:hypothetical protein FNU76_19665 [Chitinimonas arctica]|uniref:Uncharacterized protein n=1 Tax=Chitinimonas arctica TaxID=2594795 RepID=A0A516SJQ6_9NEIS|nr:hypothetical protein [Chitinimonas arctica]QDQ28392.1 hypothetical protein FNU76_19665 [Chitinimonas arctica]